MRHEILTPRAAEQNVQPRQSPLPVVDLVAGCDQISEGFINIEWARVISATRQELVDGVQGNLSRK